MTIFRGQMYRELKNRGGIMQLEPRQQYGLGSLVKKAVKGVTGAVKDIVSSDLGKAALLAAGGYYLGGGNLFGLQRAGLSTPGFAFSNLPGASLFSKAPAALKTATQTFAGKNLLTKGATLLTGSALLTSLFGSPQAAQMAYQRDPNIVRQYLKQYYENINPGADPMQVDEFVESQMSEYSAKQELAFGGRVGLAGGTNYKFMELIDEEGEDEYYRKKAEELDMKYNPQRYTPPPKKPVDFEGKLKRLMKAKGMLDPESFEMLLKELEFERSNKAYGGPMGEPRKNQGGIMELDYRKTGGFVPIGIKEKADDVPAMLSKNEFVMTADAVRGAGNGDIEKGAQRMYKVMKTLENGGTV